MGLLESFGHLSGYKINVSKTQVLALNYTPSAEIKEMFHFNWNLKKIKYLGVYITKGISKLFKANYGQINGEILKDIQRWSTLPLDFSSRIETVRMNILPRLLYLFQSLPIEVARAQFVNWDRTISRFIWAGKKPRVRYKTLQLSRDKGGMGLPNLKEYFNAAQLRYIVCWCKPDYMVKWKDMEREFGEYPIQSIVGDKDTFNQIKKHMDSITVFTLELWFKIVKVHRIQEDTKVLKWVGFDSNFAPARYGGFKQWVNKGVTAWCTLEKKGEMEGFQDMREKYGLGKQEFFRYLQLRDYYGKCIRRKSSMEENGVIQIIVNSYRGKKTRTISALYKALTTNKYSTTYIKEKWESEFNTQITDDDSKTCGECIKRPPVLGYGGSSLGKI